MPPTAMDVSSQSCVKEKMGHALQELMKRKTTKRNYAKFQREKLSRILVKETLDFQIENYYRILERENHVTFQREYEKKKISVLKSEL